MTMAVDDTLWAAIGDPTRRDVLDLLVAGGGATATAIAGQLPVSRQAVARHLQVLDAAGLVHGEIGGRERHFRVDEAVLGRAIEQLRTVSSTWDRRLSRIKKIAERIEKEAAGTDT